MNISMLGGAKAMRGVLDRAPSDRVDAVRDLWKPMAGMYHFIPGGLDMASVHRQNFGFPIDATPEVDEQIRQSLDELEAADAWTRVHRALEAGVAALASADSSLRFPDLRILLLLGDPTNRHFMDEVRGLSGFGGISGYIALILWPTQRVLERLEAIAVPPNCTTTCGIRPTGSSGTLRR